MLSKNDLLEPARVPFGVLACERRLLCRAGEDDQEVQNH